MQSELAFFEGPEDALKEAIRVLGGSKKVGPMFWPDKTVEAASRSLLDAINPSRAEKLEITQIMFIFKKAREVGCHGPFAWFSAEVGYQAVPMTAADDKERLIGVIEQSSRALASAVAAVERLRLQDAR